MAGDDLATDVQASGGNSDGVSAEGEEVIETEEETEPKLTP